MMTRYGLGALGVACSLAFGTAPEGAQAQSLTVPPDLRAPSEAAAPESTERGKARSANPKRDKRTAQTKARSTKAPTPSVGQPEGRRMYPPELDRSESSGSSVRPSMTPSGRMGIGGRF